MSCPAYSYIKGDLTLSQLITEVSKRQGEIKMKYYVYNPDGRMPKHQHDTYSEALQEATRLAIKEMSPMYIIQIRAKVCPQYSCEVVDFEEQK